MSMLSPGSTDYSDPLLGWCAISRDIQPRLVGLHHTAWGGTREIRDLLCSPEQMSRSEVLTLGQCCKTAWLSFVSRIAERHPSRPRDQRIPRIERLPHPAFADGMQVLNLAGSASYRSCRRRRVAVVLAELPEQGTGKSTFRNGHRRKVEEQKVQSTRFPRAQLPTVSLGV